MDLDAFAERMAQRDADLAAGRWFVPDRPPALLRVVNHPHGAVTVYYSHDGDVWTVLGIIAPGASLQVRIAAAPDWITREV